MCIILDANCIGDFRNRANSDLQPVRQWMDKRNGKIAYSDTNTFRREWKAGGLDHTQLNRAGRLKLVPKEDVLRKQEVLEGQLESDDPHIISLALVAGIKVLVVQRQPNQPLRGGRRRAKGADTALQRDFKRFTRGNVYMFASHRRLLKSDLCP